MTEYGQVRRLLATYALTLDAADIDGCLRLFEVDGEFLVYGKTLKGRDRIRRLFETAPQGMHLIGAMHIAVNGDQAIARSQVLFVDSSPLLLRPALYDDELTKLADRWLFRRRRCQFITATGAGRPPGGESRQIGRSQRFGSRGA